MATITYTVRAGDTLSAIAQSHGTSVAHIASTNGIADPDVIGVGQQLTFTTGGAQASTGASQLARSYTVQPGDTLGAIAVRFGTSASMLATVNGITDPDRIYAGQTLRIGRNASHAASGVAASSGPGTNERALQAALTKVGAPYRFGSAGPTHFDCSGLIRWAFAQAGRDVPHRVAVLATMGQPVSRTNLQRGDLVFFRTDPAQPARISHVGIYAGGGTIMHASNPETPARIVNINTPYYENAYAGARRL